MGFCVTFELRPHPFNRLGGTLVERLECGLCYKEELINEAFFILEAISARAFLVSSAITNPRRACAARVTVLSLSVSLLPR